MTPEKNLDKILTHFNRPEVYLKDEFYSESYKQLHAHFVASGFSAKEYTMIIENLCIDKYLDCNFYSIEGTNPIKYTDEKNFFITFKGKTFIENGGYRKQKCNANLRIIGTWFEIGILCIGSLAAAGLLILEYVKFHQNCLCH